MILEEPQFVKTKMDLKDNSTLIPHFRDEEIEPKRNYGIFHNFLPHSDYNIITKKHLIKL